MRLVVDTGLHDKGWTEQQTVVCFKANTAIPDATVRSEAQRYITWPGTATAYKIGMLRIQELRQGRGGTGSASTSASSTTPSLGGGALPINLLERRAEL